MPAPTVVYHRYRFVVPETDAAVCDWVGAQSDLSLSLRLLVREHVQRCGYSDVFADAMDAGVFSVAAPTESAPTCREQPARESEPAPASSASERIARMQGSTAAASMRDMLNG